MCETNRGRATNDLGKLALAPYPCPDWHPIPSFSDFSLVVHLQTALHLPSLPFVLELLELEDLLAALELGHAAQNSMAGRAVLEGGLRKKERRTANTLEIGEHGEQKK